jgi:hypothetical protein
MTLLSDLEHIGVDKFAAWSAFEEQVFRLHKPPFPGRLRVAFFQRNAPKLTQRKPKPGKVVAMLTKCLTTLRAASIVNLKDIRPGDH